MFRFKIIEPKNSLVEKQAINFKEEESKCFQEIKNILMNQGDTVLILAEKDKRLIGGSFLVRQELTNIQEDVRELVATLSLHNCIWECSMVCLEKSYEYLDSLTPESEYHLQSFYRELYEGFVEFGRIKGIGFLIMKLSPKVYNSTKIYGLWPYVVELKPDNSLDGLFHGILPLTGSQYIAYRKSWEVEHKH